MIFIITSYVLSFTVFAQVDTGSDTLVELRGIEIRASKSRPVPYQVDFIEQKSISAEPAKDLGLLLRDVPNVSGVRKGGMGIDPVVRGFKFSQLNIQVNNGLKIEGGCPNRMDPAVAHIDADDITKLEVIKGPYALRYGPVMGSVINIKTMKPMPNERFKVHLKGILGYESNWGGMKQHLSVFGGSRKVYFSLSGNYKDYGDYKSGNDIVVKSGFTRYNWSANLGVSPAKGHNIIISFDDSHARNVYFPALPMDERKDDTRLISLDYRIDEISRNIKDFSLKVYHSDVNHLMDNKERPFSDTVVAVSGIHAINQGLRAETRISLGQANVWIGGDYENISKDGDRTKTKILEPTMPVMTEKLWNDAEIENLGFFAQYDRLFNKTELVTIARIDMNQAKSGDLLLKRKENILYSNSDVESKYTNLSFSVSGTYHFNSKWSLGLILGRGVRSPDMSERYIILLPVGYDPYDYLGNPQLKPEANNEIDIKAEYANSPIGHFNFVSFFSYVQDYITGKYVPPSQVKPQTAGVLGVKEFYNEDYVLLYGFEFAYMSPKSYDWGLNANIAYTAGINPEATALVVEDGQVLGEEIINNDPLPEIPPLEGNISFVYRLFNNKLVPELRTRFVASQEKISVSYGEETTPGFITADLRLSYHFNKYLDVHGGVNNIFDKAYYEHLNRRIIGTKQNLYEPGRVFYINLVFSI